MPIMKTPNIDHGNILYGFITRDEGTGSAKQRPQAGIWTRVVVCALAPRVRALPTYCSHECPLETDRQKEIVEVFFKFYLLFYRWNGLDLQYLYIKTASHVCCTLKSMLHMYLVNFVCTSLISGWWYHYKSSGNMHRRRKEGSEERRQELFSCFPQNWG